MSTVYQDAKALYLSHGFDPDIAFLSAWYSRNSEMPTVSTSVVFANLARVKRPSKLSDADAERMLAAYTRHKRGGR